MGFVKRECSEKNRRKFRVRSMTLGIERAVHWNREKGFTLVPRTNANCNCHSILL